MSTAHSPVRTPPAPTLAVAVETIAAGPLSFDERWHAWQAKGAAHDRALRRKLALAAPLVVVIAAAILYAFVIR